MSSVMDDRTARAVIRDEALRLFAARGADAVTVRQVAESANVSPALVMHHFGSKDALREDVDRYVLHVIDAVLGEVASGAESPTKAVLQHLAPDSPVPAYLRRLLLDGGDAGRRLFRRLHEVSRAHLDRMVETGIADPGADPAVRAAFLLVNDLAVLMLRGHLTDVLGTDPLSAPGMTRWTDEVATIYGRGLRRSEPAS
ncbi:TetR family transcriptional regulator [Actinomadura sp. B10D3]|uniref:TetR/AcrR family transcriptional regulator n=1 Tax=Actinomadura sp. B10D3 TaxID=3153557 RepID=UPI00325D8BB8